MSELTIERQYNRAKYVAKIKGHRDIADDFASWYVIKLLEGKSQHQLVDHTLIDFLRVEYGGVGLRGSPDGLSRSRRAKEVLRQDETFEECAERLLASVSLSQWNDQRFAVLERETINVGGILSDREAEIWEMYTQDELTLKEIGIAMGFTESRASQLLKNAVRKTQNTVFVDTLLESVTKDARAWVKQVWRVS